MACEKCRCDAGYRLPELRVTQHTIPADIEQVREQGLLFAEPAKTLTERRSAKKATVSRRVEAVVELVTQGCSCQRQSLPRKPENTPNGSDARFAKIQSIEPDSKQTERRRARKRKEKKSPEHIESLTSHAATKFCESDTPAILNIESDFISSASSEDTDSRLESMSSCLPSSMANVQSASEHRTTSAPDASQALDCASTTATSPARSADCYVDSAMSGSVDSKTIRTESKWPRCICGAARSEQWIIWAELNVEQEALVDAIGPDAISITGSMPSELKESSLAAWLRGDVRVLVSKASILGWGINMQNACRMAFVGVNDSFESYYQAIRRCWRFGQKRPVEVHVFASELEGDVVRNLQRKERDAVAMAEQLSAETRDAVRAEVRGQTRQTATFTPKLIAKAPSWLLRKEGAA